MRRQAKFTYQETNYLAERSSKTNEIVITGTIQVPVVRNGQPHFEKVRNSLITDPAIVEAGTVVLLEQEKIGKQEDEKKSFRIKRTQCKIRQYLFRHSRANSKSLAQLCL